MSNILNPANLRCEYRVDPLGLTVKEPRLSWTVESKLRNMQQAAYQILAARTLEELAQDHGTLWDSGQILSDESNQIVYAGVPLGSDQRVYWKVRVWNDWAAEPSDFSAPALFQTGLLESDDWTAQWVGMDTEGEEDQGKKPVVYLRKAFNVDKPVTQATLFATAKGVYRPHLNGSRVGVFELAPGWTDYNLRYQVQAYDVTASLSEGENVLGALLGEGWYSGFIGFKGVYNYYGEQPRLLMQLMICYADGSSEIIATDEAWQAATGPVVWSDIQMGEKYDARLELGAWDTAGFDASGWNTVLVDAIDEKVALDGQPNQPMEVTKEVKVQSVTEVEPGVFIFDLGQNIAGWITLRTQGPAGTEIRIRYGEMLEPDGNLHTANLRSARATDYYTCKGEGKEVYEPTFTYHGFRYVELTGCAETPTVDSITGRVMHNAMPMAGSFECSHPKVNQLWNNIVWGQRGNFISIPTDCPQRDERLGWSGDAQIFCRTASFNMDVSSFFTKWMVDYTDAQTPEGAFTDIAPNIAQMGPGCAAWGDAGVIIPWTIYRVYGDTRIIETHYEAMVAWMNYIAEVNPFYLRTRRLNNNYSDWVSLEGGSSAEQIATAYWAKIADMMAEMAEAIGRNTDAEYYTALYDSIREAYIQAYVNPDGRIETNTQTAYVMALDNDLLPDTLIDAAAANLQKALKNRNMHLATGFVGTPPLCFVLADNGYLDSAYQLLNNETYPSWLYMVNNGATTMWERWNGYVKGQGIHDPGMNSFNHYAYGSIAEWMYRVILGIDAAEPGYKHIILQPQPGGDYTYAKGSYESINGTIKSAWCVKDDGMHYDFTVPANTTATVVLVTGDPYSITEGGDLATESDDLTFLAYENGRAVFDIGSGDYHFVVKK